MNTVTMLAMTLHVAGGFVGLLSGVVAISARKGGRLHRRAGNVFFVSMMIMAVFACYLGAVIPGQTVNVFISLFASYLLATAWMTVRRKQEKAGLFEKGALAVSLCLSAPFVLLSGELALEVPPFFESAVPLKGPVLIAIFSFTLVIVIAAVSDAKLVLRGGISDSPRIARHLWRMCLGLTLATGSAFTNGFARMLPGPYHVPLAFFFPQFIPLILLFYWMIRVRFTGWYRGDTTGLGTQPVEHRFGRWG